MYCIFHPAMPLLCVHVHVYTVTEGVGCIMSSDKYGWSLQRLVAEGDMLYPLANLVTERGTTVIYTI